MRKVFALLALATTACQPHEAPPTRAATAAPVVAAVTDPKPPLTALPPAPAAVADSLTLEMRTMLRQVDISRLFLAPEPGKVGDYAAVLDGFFGNNPQRLSLAILRVTQDSLRPGLFHVAGKTRFKQQITNFRGEIQVASVADYYDQGLLLTQNEDSFVQDTTEAGQGDITNARAYSAAADFCFTSVLPNAYVLTGQALLDFWVTDKGKIGTLYPPSEGAILEKAPTKGSGLLLNGTWRDATNSQKPFLVSRNIFLLSPGIIGDFGIGDRGSQVNPKYAKLGWNTYWENDEWWADAPKVALNL